MRVLITGADGFIGKNLELELGGRKYDRVIISNACGELQARDIDEADFIFHLLTLYRSEEKADFERVNVEMTRKLVKLIGSRPKSLLLASSIQAGNGTPYGQSKLLAEECVIEWAKTTGNKAYIFRLTNEFGKWCPPYMNSVIATFCHEIANCRELTIVNEDAKLSLVYIDDIIRRFVSVLEGKTEDGYCDIEPIYDTTVGEVAKIISSFPAARALSNIPDIDNRLTKNLYSTFLSYLPSDRFSYPLRTYVDNRGAFTELAHFGGLGQVSVNISKVGVTKGNHWHHTKTEKFIVVSGEAVIRFRKVGTDAIVTYRANGSKLEVIDIPPGYTHNITNVGDTDMVTIIWASEVFNSENADTYFEEV